MRALLALLLLLAPGLAWADAFSSVPPPQPPAPGVQVICNRSGSPMLGTAAPSLQRWNQRMQVTCPYGARTMQFLLPGWSQGGGQVGSYRGELTIPDGVRYLKSATLVSGGSGYVAGSSLQLPIWGLGLEEAIIQIDEVSGGVITKFHVTRGGAYTVALTDGTGPQAVWEAGLGYGGHYESNGFTGSNLNSYNMPANNGGANWVAGTTSIVVASGPSCTGGTISTGIDGFTGSIANTAPAGTWTCTDTTHQNAVYAVSSCAAACGTGATFNFQWGGAAYMVRISVDPTYTNEACSTNSNGSCAHRVVSATTGHPANSGPDITGTATDIYVGGGTNVLTDPIPVNIPIGGSAGIRILCVGSCPRGRYTQLSGEAQSQSFQTYDSTMSGTYGTAFPTPGLAMQIEAIIGIPQVSGPALLVVGDSREAGTTGIGDLTGLDTQDLTQGLVGPDERATQGRIPYINMSRSGGALYDWSRLRALRYDAFRQIARAGKFPELCAQHLRVNDYHNGSSFAVGQPQEAQLVADMRGFGCKLVYTSTVDPYVAGSGTTTGMAQANITVAGTGYGATTTFTATITGGTCTTQPTVQLTTDAGGVPRQVGTVTPGLCTATPTFPNTVTGGAGSGLTITGFMSNVTTGTQTPNGTTTTNLQLANTQLRTAGFGSYAGIYDQVVDYAGVVETAAGSGLWPPFCTFDGVHAAIPCIISKAAVLAPLQAQWAATAFGIK